MFLCEEGSKSAHKASVIVAVPTYHLVAAGQTIPRSVPMEALEAIDLAKRHKEQGTVPLTIALLLCQFLATVIVALLSALPVSCYCYCPLCCCCCSVSFLLLSLLLCCLLCQFLAVALLLCQFLATVTACSVVAAALPVLTVVSFTQNSSEQNAIVSGTD